MDQEVFQAFHVQYLTHFAQTKKWLSLSLFFTDKAQK